jgi:hypothetical protein
VLAISAIATSLVRGGHVTLGECPRDVRQARRRWRDCRVWLTSRSLLLAAPAVASSSIRAMAMDAVGGAA